MKNTLHCLSLIAVAAVAVLLSGCNREVLTPSDISLEQLESFVQRATDPDNRYANAKSSLIRQEVNAEQSDDHLFGEPVPMQMVEVKTRRPNDFSLITYQENEPIMAIISDGKNCWYADYKKREVSTLTAKELRGVKVFQDIASPGSSLKSIFKEVKLECCTIDNEEFYKLTCKEDFINLSIYVGKRDFLTKRMTIPKQDYVSELKGYRLYEGVRVPTETIITVNGNKQRSKVVDYKLDVNFTDEDFRPPVF